LPNPVEIVRLLVRPIHLLTSHDVLVATMEEEMAGVSNGDDGNNEDGHANANDAAVAAEGVYDECCHHQ